MLPSVFNVLCEMREERTVSHTTFSFENFSVLAFYKEILQAMDIFSVSFK